MINGNLNDFVELAYAGRDLWFLYDGKKWFYQGWYENNIAYLYLDIMEPTHSSSWCWKSDDQEKNAEEFFKAKIFNGKTFWEVEKEIEWVDC